MTFSNTISSEGKQQYNSIQLLRFLAALMVIICHSTFYASERLIIGSDVYTQGSNGVSLFFVISGFVMIISSQKLLTASGGWKTFAAKRIIRIIPIYWIMTTFKLTIMLVSTALVYHSSLDFWVALKSYLFIPALNMDGEYKPLYGVGWTLNFEMFFYLLFTVAIALRIKPIPFLSTIFIVLAFLSYFKTSQWPAVGFYADTVVLNFLYGMIVAQLVLKAKFMPISLAFVTLSIGILYMFLPIKGFLDISNYVNMLFIGLASGLVVYSAASLDKSYNIGFPRFLVFLGGASYSLYLIHPTVAPLIPTILSKLHLKLLEISIILSVISSLIAGSLFFKLCETPTFLNRHYKSFLKS
jgi:exopolysaccharide production protein ExoZ